MRYRGMKQRSACRHAGRRDRRRRSRRAAQEKIDRDIHWKIRREATEHSQILSTLHMLTDVYGPRLTGSPNLKAAQDWVVSRPPSGD